MSNDQVKRLYEAMFLVDPNRGNQDWKGITEFVHGVISRHHGQVANSEKWDERKLCYSIKGHSRAVYLLVHFHAPPSELEAIRQAYHLSDLILRSLILVDEDGLSSEIRSLPDEPTDPVRSTRRERDRAVPERRHGGGHRDRSPERGSGGGGEGSKGNSGG
ncbi:MAG: 30S ribosomal protein S6 [Planctomycetes bacterium]|nr:30S ribosomal protein S6 [Planctomycetota bacterium]